ncbi:MAG: pyridoxal phosphate-dependent aminotransferase family protein [Bacteroidia bacterium]
MNLKRDKYGIHSAGAAILTGRSSITDELEKRIATILQQDQALVFSSGWMACFSAIAGLVTKEDCIVMDSLSHNCLDVAAHYATTNVFKFMHNNIEDLENKLKSLRAKNAQNGIFIVVESLYSMNSDGPDLKAIQQLAITYDAILIIDVAHDFGCLGTHGLGNLENMQLENAENLVITGSFSKTFASNGGFVAGSQVIRQRITFFGPTYTFSNAISPVQCAIVNSAMQIVFSHEGELLRAKLMENILHILKCMHQAGFKTNGNPSAIIPVLIGDERLARLISKNITQSGVIANLIEYPAVPRGKAIFRFQMMANYTKDVIEKTLALFIKAYQRASAELEIIDGQKLAA